MNLDQNLLVRPLIVDLSEQLLPAYVAAFPSSIANYDSYFKFHNPLVFAAVYDKDQQFLMMIAKIC